MPLRVITRKDTGTLQIEGRIYGQRIRKAAQSQKLALAREEAAAIEARILHERFHGKRRADRTFAEIAEAYLDFEARHPAQVERVLNIVAALGDVSANEVDQETVDDLRKKLIRKPDPSPSTVRALVVTPVRCVLNFGFRRKWCDKPAFELPRQRKGRTVFMTPDDADRLITAAAPHLRALLVFLFGVGSRLAETLALDWHDIDLVNARAIIVQKGGRQRIAQLPPAVVAELAALPHREGRVFQWTSRRGTGGYAEKPKGGGGQIKTAWNAALRRAGLDGRGLTPHATRHTFASWHYAVYRDLLRLKAEGGWETLAMVERYAHLLPGGHERAILAFWGYPDTQAAMDTHWSRGTLAGQVRA